MLVTMGMNGALAGPNSHFNLELCEVYCILFLNQPAFYLEIFVKNAQCTRIIYFMVWALPNQSVSTVGLGLNNFTRLAGPESVEVSFTYSFHTQNTGYLSP